MKRLIPDECIKKESLPEIAILIANKQETIIGVTFFKSAYKIEVEEERFLCYGASMSGKEAVLIEAGEGVYTLLSRMEELKNKGVKNFIFVNKGLSVNKKISEGDILLVLRSELYSHNKVIDSESDIVKKDYYQNDIKKGSNITIEMNDIFFKKNIDKKKLSTGDAVSVSDFYFLQYLKKNKLSGFSINYITGDVFKEIKKKDDEYFKKAMEFVVGCILG